MYTEQDGCRLAFVDEGTGEPPILFLHGHAGAIVEWDATVSALCHRFHCIAPDLPGHGLSCIPHVSAATLDLVVKAVIRFLDELAAGPVVAVGHSMGGRVAAHVALERPELIRALVMVNAPADQPLPLSLKLLTRFVPLDLLPFLVRRRRLFRRFIHHYSSRMVRVPNPLTRRKAEFFRELRSREDMSVRIRYLTALGRDVFRDDLDRRLPKIESPVLVVWSDGDPTCPLASGRLIREHVKKGRLIVMKGCAHNPHLEQFDAFNEHLIRFVASLDHA